MIVFFFLFISCAILAHIIRLCIWRRNCSLLIPGRRQGLLNLFGDSTEFLYNYYIRNNHESIYHYSFKYVKDMFNEFRNEPFFCMWLACEPVVMIYRADSVKELLQGMKLKEKSSFYNILKPYFGNGLITSPDAIWRPRRKLLNRCFHSEILKDYQAVFDEHARRLADSLQEETEKDFTNIEAPLKQAAFEIICETMFGVSVGSKNEKYAEYMKVICRCEEVFLRRVVSFYMWPDFIFRFTKYYKVQQYCMKVAREISKSVLQEKISQYLKDANEKDVKKRKSFMDLLLDRHFKFQDLSEEDIREEADTFIVAGHDTTGITLMWVMFLIGHHPEVQAKLHEELDRTFGKDMDTPISVNDLNYLEYMDCVIKESNRIYPVVPFYGRQANNEVEMCGYTIPKGASCIVISYYLHRDETVFPDPEKFDPDRFSPENEKKIPEYAYVPFSAGPRNCIGKTFAMMEIKTVLAAVLRRYKLHSLTEREKVTPLFQITLNPSIPIQVQFRNRH